MATATTNVQLNVTGNAVQSLQKIQQQTDKLAKSFSGLKGILGGLAIGSLVTNMFRAADATTDLADASGLAVSSIIALRQAFQQSGSDAEGAEKAILKLYTSIQEAADGNDQLINSFAKVGVSLQDLGNLSEEEILNKVITGLAELGNTAEAVAVKMALTGKEGRKVDFASGFVEQYNKVKQAAKEVEPGIKAAGKIFDNINKFKSDFGTELAKQFSGLLTSLQQLTTDTKGLAKSLAELTKILAVGLSTWFLFAKVLPGIRIAMNLLELAILKSGGTLNTFKTLILNVVSGFFRLGAGLGTITEALGKQGVAGALVTAAQRFFTLSSIIANVLRIFVRFAGVAGIIYTVVTALDFLFKNILKIGSPLEWLGKQWDKLSNLAKEFFGLVLYGDKDYFKSSTEGAKQLDDQLQEVEIDSGKTRDRLQQIREENEKFLASVREITKAYKEQNVETIQNLNNEIRYLHMTEEQISLDKNRLDIQKQLNQTLDELEKKRKEALADPSKGAAVVDQIDREIIAARKSAKETLDASQIKIQQYNVEAEAIARRNEKLKEAMEDIDLAGYIADLQEEVRLSGLYGDELDRETRLSKIQSQLQSTIRDKTKEILELKQKMAEGTITQAAYNTELELINKQIEAAYKRAEAETEATDTIIANMKRVEMQKSVFDNLDNALKNFIDTGKFKFKDFAASIVRELLYIQAKAALTPIFSAISGGIGGFVGKLFGFAEGGSPPVGKASVVGEKGPELFVPKSAGTIIPNDKLVGNRNNNLNAPITNNYNTYNINAVDAKSVAQLFAENRRSLLGSVQMAQRELPYGAR